MGDQKNSSMPPCPWGAPIIDSPAWGSPVVTSPQPGQNRVGNSSPHFSPYNSHNNSLNSQQILPLGSFQGQGHNSPNHFHSNKFNSSPRGSSRGRQQFTPQRNNYQSSSSNTPSPHTYSNNSHCDGASSPRRHQLQNRLGYNNTPSPNHRFQSNRGFQSPGQRFQGRGSGHRQSGSHFNPRAYVNASMLENPWKDLVPTAMMKSY